VIPWHSLGHLVLDEDGTLWLWTDPGFRRLGPIADAEVAPELADDLAALLDLWEDATTP
jgi:hypothetical protein